MSESVVLEPCHSIWIFDTEEHRFQRLVKGVMAADAPTTGWRPYFGLDVDPKSHAFVVLLDQDATRLLRSWRHVEPSPRCSDACTGELDLGDLREAARAEGAPRQLVGKRITAALTPECLV